MKTAVTIKIKTPVGVLVVPQIFIGVCYVVGVIGVGAILIIAAIGLAVPGVAIPYKVSATGSSNSVTLTWTAPGDDNAIGLADQYDIRYSTSPITEENFSAATAVVNPPVPQAAGATETFEVTGLEPDTLYYFALKTADEVPNWSSISNIVSKKTAPAYVCTPSWSCTGWSVCRNSLSTRQCIDLNNCGTDSGKPITQRSCTMPVPTCTESWSCGSWSVCYNSSQSRTCTDANSCGTVIYKPVTQRSCIMPVPACTESWSCADWGDCQNSIQSRTCTDANSCGTETTKPDTQRSCTMPVSACTEDWSCTDWADCSRGFQRRVCLDQNDCGTTDDKPEEVISCAVGGQEPLSPQEKYLVVSPTLRSGPHVRLYRRNFQLKSQFFAYDLNFRNGVNAALGDVDGDGSVEILTGTGPGSAPHVRIFDTNGQVKYQFFAYPEHFRIGVVLTTGDIDGCGRDEIIVAPQARGGAQIRIFKFQPENKSFTVYNQYFVYPLNFRLGLNLASTDLNLDGRAEIIVAPISYGGPHVRVFNIDPVTGDLKLYSQFFAYDYYFRGGVNLTTGDVDNDGREEIITGPGTTGASHIRIFDDWGRIKYQFFAANIIFRGGAEVASFDYDLDGADEVITATYSAGPPGVFVFDKKGNEFIRTINFSAYSELYREGIRIDAY
ncbi:MAG: fibronectin type III domain-containing protein [Patescibacteria group bacterium]